MSTAPALDVAALEFWLRQNLAGFRGPCQLQQFSGGQSNPTYRLSTPERDYVLRRKPSGELLQGAHAIEREFAVISALGRVGFPVPAALVMCEDSGVVGTPFYIMEFVDGRIFWDARLETLPVVDRAAYFDAMNATIARLHGLDPAAIGLAEFGRPGNYFARQIARWSRQYQQDEQAGRDEWLDRLIDWLPQNIPPGDETALVHGDFRCDNLVFHPIEPHVIAVLDWELSTLGHPLADFTYHAMMYRVPPTIVTGLAGADLAALGLPSERQYVAAYCARTGRDGIPNYEFYIAYNLFRFAAILHGIRGRLARGTASSANAEQAASNVGLFARLAWQQVERGAG